MTGPGTATADQPLLQVSGEARDLSTAAGSTSEPIRLALADTTFEVALGRRPPFQAAYRDVTTIAVDQGRVLLVLGGGAVRLLVERLGEGLGALVGGLRDRRARQWLADRLIAYDEIEAIELVEYEIPGEHGVGQLAYHRWGVALLPLDERLPRHSIRRGEISAVESDAAHGTLVVQPGSISLLGLGQDARRHGDRIAALREAALADASAIVTRLMPDAPMSLRMNAGSWLVDGRPVNRSAFGGDWSVVEAAVLREPTFAASYRALIERAGADAPSWIALAPRQPGNPDDHVAWFFVGLPGNLIALEIVSTGSHATYVYRIVPGSRYRGESPAALLPDAETAVAEISGTLVDIRYLREPIYLTTERLAADPKYLRYRLAIAALPSLQATRARFVGRLFHTDEEAWKTALDDVIRWNVTTREDDAVWPGNAAVDSTFDEEAS